jgi:hypothetical protein
MVMRASCTGISVKPVICLNITSSGSLCDSVTVGTTIRVSELSTLGVDHASIDLGAKTLGTNKEAKSVNSLLKYDSAKFWISPCVLASGVNWFAIELNQEVYVHTLVLGTFEYYSSTIKNFQLMGQIEYSADSWQLLGSFQALPGQQYQYFKLRKPLLAKFIQIHVLSHHGTKFYCTLNSVRDYGYTTWEEPVLHFEAKEEGV